MNQEERQAEELAVTGRDRRRSPKKVRARRLETWWREAAVCLHLADSAAVESSAYCRRRRGETARRRPPKPGRCCCRCRGNVRIQGDIEPANLRVRARSCEWSATDEGRRFPPRPSRLCSSRQRHVVLRARFRRASHADHHATARPPRTRVSLRPRTLSRLVRILLSTSHGSSCRCCSVYCFAPARDTAHRLATCHDARRAPPPPSPSLSFPSPRSRGPRSDCTDTRRARS